MPEYDLDHLRSDDIEEVIYSEEFVQVRAFGGRVLYELGDQGTTRYPSVGAAFQAERARLDPQNPPLAKKEETREFSGSVPPVELGRLARSEGRSIADCPFPEGDRADAWLRGYGGHRS